MKIRGVLLGTLEEQRAGGDAQPVDPAAVELPDHAVPLTINFDKSRIIGRATAALDANGRLVFEAELDAGASVDLGRLPREGVGPQVACYGGRRNPDRLYEVSLAEENENRNQPRWEIVDPLDFRPPMGRPRPIVEGPLKNVPRRS